VPYAYPTNTTAADKECLLHSIIVLLLGYMRTQDYLEHQISVCDLRILNGAGSNFVLLTCAWV